MEGFVGSLGAVGVVLILGVLALLTILLPLSVYSAQKYAYKCFGELKNVSAQLKSVNANLKDMNSRLDASNESMRYLAEVEANKLSAGRAREAGA